MRRPGRPGRRFREMITFLTQTQIQTSMKIVIIRDTFGPEGKFLGVGTVIELSKQDAIYLVNRGKARPFTEEDEAAAKKAAKADK